MQKEITVEKLIVVDPADPVRRLEITPAGILLDNGVSSVRVAVRECGDAFVEIASGERRLQATATGTGAGLTVIDGERHVGLIGEGLVVHCQPGEAVALPWSTLVSITRQVGQLAQQLKSQFGRLANIVAGSK